MAEYLIQGETLDDIVEATNQKAGTLVTMTPAEVVTAINNISVAERLSWHQCPEAVRNYLAYVAEHPYTASDNNVTYILDFAPDPAAISNTKPVGFTVDGVTYRNNVPLVVTPFATANKAGTLTALDKLRWINTTPAPASGSPYEKGLNCRDLGGWDCDGGTVKYGMLVRSGEINAADKVLMVDEIGIKTEINLLPGNVQGRDVSVWGIDYVENPTDNDFMYSISSTYADQWLLYLQTAFRSVAHSKPVIFHCGAGADKTATLACMLMGVLGCSECDIDTDYELTMFSLYQAFRNRTYEAWWRFKDAIKAVPLANGLSDSFQNRCVSFALSLGITLDEINAFRSACINGNPTPISPAYTNLADPSSPDWVLNKRIANDGTLKDATGAVVTNYIPCKTGDVVRVFGLGALNQYNMWICNSDKSVYSTGIPSNDTGYYAYDSQTGIVSITVRGGGTTNKYLRITGVLAGSSDDVIITVNENIL